MVFANSQVSHVTVANTNTVDLYIEVIILSLVCNDINVAMVTVTALVIGASLSEPHTSESPPQILVLSTMHKKLRQKSDNLRVRRQFNGVDYSAFLYGLCNRPCHDK